MVLKIPIARNLFLHGSRIFCTHIVQKSALIEATSHPRSLLEGSQDPGWSWSRDSFTSWGEGLSYITYFHLKTFNLHFNCKERELLKCLTT